MPKKKLIQKPTDVSSKQRMIINSLEERIFVNDTMMRSRTNEVATLGKMYEGERDVYSALGWKNILNFNDYDGLFKRNGYGEVVVSAYPKATWRKGLQVIASKNDDAFAKAWKNLIDKKRLISYLQRADIVSGIGEYGVMFIGYDDKKTPDLPVTKAGEITFMQPYSQGCVTINEMDIEKSPKEERYGKPVYYTVALNANIPQQRMEQRIHYTRILHIAENMRESDLYGTPRLQACFNNVKAMDLITGGSGEMFWRGAFPGLAFEMDPTVTLTDDTKDDMSDEIELYIHQLRSYLQLQAVKVKQLFPQLATNPKDYADMQLDEIAATTRIPKRIIIGSEEAKQASISDDNQWNDHVDERRTDHAEPNILRPFIDMQILLGVLPDPGEYTVAWPSSDTSSRQEQVAVMSKEVEALAKFADSQASRFIPLDMFMTDFLRWPEEKVKKLKTARPEIFAKIEELEKEKVEAERTATRTEPSKLTGDVQPDLISDTDKLE